MWKTCEHSIFLRLRRLATKWVNISHWNFAFFSLRGKLWTCYFRIKNKKLCLFFQQTGQNEHCLSMGVNGKRQKFGMSFLVNPLSAKPSFQLWYPGGQRLKVISFSWSWVKSPSKCFSNTEPTTIIASRDEKKRCNASVQWTRSVHSSSLRLSDQHRKSHGWLLFFAVPALQPDRPAAVHPRPRKQRSAKRQRRRVSETGSSKLAGL